MGIGMERCCSAYDPFLGSSIEVSVQVPHVRTHVGEAGSSIAWRGSGSGEEHLDHLRAGYQVLGAKVRIGSRNDAGSGSRLDKATEIAESGTDIGKELSATLDRRASAEPDGDFSDFRPGDAVAQAVRALGRLSADDVVGDKRSCVRSELALGGSCGQENETRSHDRDEREECGV